MSAAAAVRTIGSICPMACSSRTTTSRWRAASCRHSSAPTTIAADRQPIEIEVRTLAEMEQALAHGAEALLLDGMSVEDVRKAVEYCSHREKRIPVECAGGIKLENVRAYAETGVDFISVGALTHFATAVDMNLRIAQA